MRRIRTSAFAGAARRVLPPDARVLIEPGRSMIAAAGVSLYRATSGRTFVAVDGGMGDNLEVSLYGQRFEAAREGAHRPVVRRETFADLVRRDVEWD